jgi:hypothetical protein
MNGAVGVAGGASAAVLQTATYTGCASQPRATVCRVARRKVYPPCPAVRRYAAGSKFERLAGDFLDDNVQHAVRLSEGASRRFVAEPPDLLGYCRWDGRSGHVTTPDNLRVDFQVAPTHRMRLPEPDSGGTELPPGRLAQW